MADEPDATTTDVDASAAAGADTGADQQADKADNAGGEADKSSEPIIDHSKLPFGEDWRTTMASFETGEADADVLKLLGRYHSPGAALKAYKTDSDAIKRGEFIKLPGDKATDEERAAFNKALGVPETPDKYADAFDGFAPGEDDKPRVDALLDTMHKAGAPPPVVNAALKFYYDMQAEDNSAYEEQVSEARANAEEELRQEWGGDYKRNIDAAKAYLETADPVLKDMFMGGARFADGTPLGVHPGAIKFLMGLTLEANPMATVVPGAGANQASAIADELAEINKLMGQPNSDYWKGPKSGQLQARARELIEAQDKLKGR